MGVCGNEHSVGMELGDWRVHLVPITLSTVHK